LLIQLRSVPSLQVHCELSQQKLASQLLPPLPPPGSTYWQTPELQLTLLASGQFSQQSSAL
jgi:hypothetical protein